MPFLRCSSGSSPVQCCSGSPLDRQNPKHLSEFLRLLTSALSIDCAAVLNSWRLLGLCPTFSHSVTSHLSTPVPSSSPSAPHLQVSIHAQGPIPWVPVDTIHTFCVLGQGVPHPKYSKIYISISGHYPLGASSTTSSPPSKRNQKQLTLLNAPKGEEEGENKSPLWQRASKVNWTTAHLQATPNSCVYLWDLVFMVAVK